MAAILMLRRIRCSSQALSRNIALLTGGASFTYQSLNSERKLDKFYNVPSSAWFSSWALELLGPRILICEVRDNQYDHTRETHKQPQEFQLEEKSTLRTEPSLGHLPSVIRPVFSFICWSLIMAIWLAAGFGPVYLVVGLLHRAWSGVLTFLCLWLLGGLIKIPEIPWLADQIANGLEYWFPRFSIKYEKVKSYQAAGGQHPRTIYCYHPHGLFSIGAALLAADLIRRGEKVAFVTSSHMRWFNPLAKLMMDIAGIEIVGATAQEVQTAMKKGDRSLILVPGGYEEAVFTQDGFERLFLNSRLGFVKYAIRFGYSLTPVYAYGENDLYRCIPFAPRLRDWLAKYKLPIVLFYGSPTMPLMPRQCPLEIVVGNPVIVPSMFEPSLDQLYNAHREYVEALSQLYYRYNKSPDRPLEII